MKTKHTPAPLFARVDEKWPFDIVTRDANGDTVFVDRMPSYSTRHETAKEAIEGKGMPPEWLAREVNERAIADAILRAAAPELLEALKNLKSAFITHTQWNGEPINEVAIANALIAKATGEQA